MANVSVDSDYDYLKILDDGQVLINANGTPDSDSTFPADPSAPIGFASSTTIQFDDGLTAAPLVRAFWDPAKNGNWVNTYRAADPWLKFIVDSQNLKLIMNTDGAAKTNIPVFYRAYDLGDTAVDSDRRIDKIFLKDTADGFAPAAASSLFAETTTFPVAHTGGTPPIWTLQFSEDNLNWQMEGLQIVGPFDTTTGPPGGPYSRYFYTSADASVDDKYIYINLRSTYATTKRIYVRFSLEYRT